MAETICTDSFPGGAGINTPGEAGSKSPSIQVLLRGIRDDFDAMRNYGVLNGLLAGAPTTPSAQLTGAGNTTWSVDLTAGTVIVNSVLKEFAAQADYAIHSGSLYTGLTNGKSAIATIVAKNVAGTVTMAVVKGAAATTGSQVAPTAAEIQAAVGAANTYVVLQECLISRTGDTTVTQAQDNTKMRIGVGTVGWTPSIIKG